jgi:hypothetical protein
LAGTFVSKGPWAEAHLNKRLLQGSAGILPALAPAAIVSALRGRIALPGEDGRKESALSCAFQNMERDAPWTAWIKMIQPRGRGELNIEHRTPNIEHRSGRI